MPMSTMKQELAQGQVMIGTMIVQAREPSVIQLFATYGLDFVFIDMEHGSYNLETAADLIHVARLAGITPLVRVGDMQYTLYSRILDAGAQGIMTPRVESVEQVRQIVRYARYPPLGERGFSRLAARRGGERTRRGSGGARPVGGGFRRRRPGRVAIRAVRRHRGGDHQDDEQGDVVAHRSRVFPFSSCCSAALRFAEALAQNDAGGRVIPRHRACATVAQASDRPRKTAPGP